MKQFFRSILRGILYRCNPNPKIKCHNYWCINWKNVTTGFIDLAGTCTVKDHIRINPDGCTYLVSKYVEEEE